MPTLSDEIGQTIERKVIDYLFFLLKELYRQKLRNEAAESGLVEDAARAATKNGPYTIANCKSPKNAKLAAAEIRKAAVEAKIPGAASMPILTGGRQVAFADSIKDIALERLAQAKIPCIIVADGIKPETTREDIADPNWDRATVVDNETGDQIDEAALRQIDGYLNEAEVEFERVGGEYVFAAKDRAAFEAALEAHHRGPSVTFEDVERDEPATEKQLQYINDLCDQGKISPEQMATFSLGATKRAATKLITAAEGSGELGPDIARDAQAAMRREDVGNVETTADYVQSRPNAGDQDRSTPYADQCDPSGAGDANGDGIRDAAQDRDGDGVIDPDDPDGIGEDTRDTQVLCEEKAQESAYIDSLPKSQTANISFQQETR